MTSESKLLGRHELAQRVGLGSRGLPAPAQAGSILESEGNSGIRLSFRVDSRYLAIHTLVGRMQPRYRGDKDVIFGFRQRAQEIDAEALDFLRGFDRPSKSLVEHGAIGQRAERLLERMAVDPAFPRILAEAQAAAALCEREWQENLPRTSAVMKEMTGLELASIVRCPTETNQTGSARFRRSPTPVRSAALP